MDSLTDLENFSRSLPLTERMPVLFVGHGNPMNAIEENPFVRGFRDIAATLPKPAAILCVSAHWFTRGTKVTAMAAPKTIHDFGGFPDALYRVEYPAPGSPSLAKETQTLLSPEVAQLDEKWGLDHGAWSVLIHMFPKADIPVVQLSIDHTQPASYHYDLAKRLAALRHKGILIMGSGNIIHNLRLADFAGIDTIGYGYDWAVEAHEKINHYLLDGNYNPLIHYEKQSRAFQLSVPTPDHYLPLIYTLGLQQKGESIALFNDQLLAGSLSMTSLKIA